MVEPENKNVSSNYLDVDYNTRKKSTNSLVQIENNPTNSFSRLYVFLGLFFLILSIFILIIRLDKIQKIMPKKQQESTERIVGITVLTNEYQPITNTEVQFMNNNYEYSTKETNEDGFVTIELPSSGIVEIVIKNNSFKPFFISLNENQKNKVIIISDIQKNKISKTK